jgi:hypothetical protein
VLLLIVSAWGWGVMDAKQVLGMLS